LIVQSAYFLEFSKPMNVMFSTE